ncbi:hypothetical protein C8Q75DRAFT_768846 [Abortiporus biennis]|nr:hypothetical protein C8Q75DRAFT_768846 [Abortiporus biennis]
MKCDARRPCSNCIRSYTYTTLHRNTGNSKPSAPECTYDEGAIAIEDEEDDQYLSILESRIVELEARLQSTNSTSTSNFSSSPPDYNTPDSAAIVSSPSPAKPQILNRNIEMSSTETTTTYVYDSVDSAAIERNISSKSDSTWDSYALAASPWPHALPPLRIVLRLAESFFKFYPDACHLLCAKNFLTSLYYPPNHAQFPSLSLVHAVCAVGGLDPEFRRTELAGWLRSLPNGEANQKERCDMFVAEQAAHARKLVEANMELGEQLFQTVQTNILLTWLHWWQARWLPAYMNVAATMRTIVTLGLNMTHPWQSLSYVLRPASLIPDPTSTLEFEERCNTFWIAYSLDRQFGSGNGWTLSLDDGDVYQTLPLNQNLFDESVHEDTREERQCFHAQDVLSFHPKNQCDPFVLSIKATVLLSKVKTFLLRYGNTAIMKAISMVTPETPRVDARKDPEFARIESNIDIFLNSIPTESRDSILHGVIDSHLCVAVTAPRLARILLHEPYAMVGVKSCPSAYNILTDARAILTLLHAVTSSGSDGSKLGLFNMFIWFTSARVLSRFLAVALQQQSAEQVSTLVAEVAFLMSFIAKLGESVPLAARYYRMLREHVRITCGQEGMSMVDSIPHHANDDPYDFEHAPEMHGGYQAEQLRQYRLTRLSHIFHLDHPKDNNETCRP